MLARRPSHAPMRRTTRTLALAAAGLAVVVAAYAGGLLLNGLFDSRGTPAPRAAPVAAAPPETVSPAALAAAAERLARRSASSPGASLVAIARGRSVALYRRPGGTPYRRLGSLPYSYGSPPVFSVGERRGGWLRVRLPIRPNHSTAWIRAASVTVSVTDYVLRIELGRHRLVVRKGGRPILRAPIGVGRAVTPTPAGRYFIAYLLRPPDPNGFFGPYAFGLSAYSNVLTAFAGGDGEIGVHGTNQPQLLGSDVSHGCIRVANPVISKLARMLPLGTPVVIARA